MKVEELNLPLVRNQNAVILTMVEKYRAGTLRPLDEPAEYRYLLRRIVHTVLCTLLLWGIDKFDHICKDYLIGSTRMPLLKPWWMCLGKLQSTANWSCKQNATNYAVEYVYIYANCLYERTVWGMTDARWPLYLWLVGECCGLKIGIFPPKLIVLLTLDIFWEIVWLLLFYSVLIFYRQQLLRMQGDSEDLSYLMSVADLVATCSEVR